MSIRVQLGDGTPEDRHENRPKIRVRLPAPEAPEPPPPKVMAFWNYDEDARRARAPWRYAESPAEQSMREQLERDGAWTG
jgi:hypothetical protein